MSLRIALLLALALPTLAPPPPQQPASPRSVSPPPVSPPGRELGRLDDEGIEELRRRLAEEADEGKRTSAVRKLAKLATHEAWTLVVQALADASPETADEAQIQLASMHDPALFEDLFGRPGMRSKDDWVRLRVAEAFGRMQLEVDGEQLALHLGDDEAEVRRHVAWSLERVARAGLLGGDRARKIFPKVERAWKSDRDPRASGGALFALHALDAAAARPLFVESLTDKRDELRCAAAAVAVRYDDALERLRPLAADRSLRVRTLAVKALGQLATKGALLALIERLETEQELRLKWIVVCELQSVTGRKNRLDPRPWRGWAQSLPDDWKAPARAKSDAEQGDRSIAFAGMSIISKRICFLIDFSGSMWEKQANGQTAKEIVDGKLRAALESLPADTQFNLIPYANEPLPFSDKLVPARSSNVKQAIEFFTSCTLRGKGDFFSAVELALSDPEVDTIMVLQDGGPTGGHRNDLDLMLELIDEKNRYHGVAFDSILVGNPESKTFASREKRWVSLAERTAGRCITIQLL